MSLEIDTYKYCEEILSEYNHIKFKEIGQFFVVLDEFSQKHNELEKKLPYHINVIKELHANENANSRILSALLQYNESGDFVLLKSFVDYFLAGKDIEISNPYITTENLRIDLLVREEGKYAIIFENKIYNAALQKNQIARYIQKMRDEGYNDKQIYVVFLPSTDMYETNACSWTEPKVECESCDGTRCKQMPDLNEKFRDRYCVVTFREGIIDWLKESVIPNCRQKEVLMYTAAVQYLDYLECHFEINTIYKNMNMELEQFLKEKLQLNNLKNEEQLIVIDAKMNEIQQLINQMDAMKVNVRKKIFNEWKQKIKTEYKDLPLLEDAFVGVTVGTIDDKKVDVVIFQEGRYYCEVHFDPKLPQEERIITNTKLMELNDILPETNGNEDCVWKWFQKEVTPDLFDCFIETIRKCKDLVDKD
ncbi:MAG: PD-(D/E)XK nuclease family protein [Salinivirgaceae bacterium]|nr:PD-(D/E)XK nuclease family protein [Salinivirgaceae bacterium]